MAIPNSSGCSANPHADKQSYDAGEENNLFSPKVNPAFHE
jgi:hypothetical protein